MYNTVSVVHIRSFKKCQQCKCLMCDRRQKVSIHEGKTDLSSVRQESMLGPTLFTMFVIKIPGQGNSDLADNTKLYTQH